MNITDVQIKEILSEVEMLIKKGRTDIEIKIKTNGKSVTIAKA